MRLEDALSTKRYWDGTKHRILYQFKCRGCGDDVWKRSGQVSQGTGLCRRCACSRPNVRLQLRPHEWRFNILLRSARERDISVTLTYEEYAQFTTFVGCHYCGEFLDWTAYKKHRASNRTYGSNLDRKDNSKGYELANCVPCCSTCNRIKNNHLSYEEMLLLAPILRGIRMNRKEQKW